MAWLLTSLGAAAAQAPVEDRSNQPPALLQSQQAAGAAYRDLQQARHEIEVAEHDLAGAQEAHRAAQKQADDLRRRTDAARKVLDAARAREAQAQKRYDAVLKGADQAFRKPPAK